MNERHHKHHFLAACSYEEYIFINFNFERKQLAISMVVTKPSFVDKTPITERSKRLPKFNFT